MLSRPLSRFPVWLIVLAAVAAGCAAPEDEAVTPTPTPSPTPSPTPTTNETFDPAPEGHALNAAQLLAFKAAFNDEALTGGQEPWPGHLVKWVNNETFVLLHFDNDDPTLATKLLWMGIGVKGVFCEQNRPAPEFTHFHKRTAATYAEGHGGAAGEKGYWLLHVAVEDFESPFGRTGHAGVDHNFGPTPPPTCEAVPAVDFETPGADALTPIDIQELKAAFSENVLRGGQEPWPGHLTTWVNPSVFMLMHFDNDSVDQATRLLWTGIGVRSTFCSTAQPDADFTHFHSAHAATYAAGHGGKANQPGYWLLHIAVADFTSPFAQTGHAGVDHAFGPTPPPAC